jgi:hypothetical protein
LCGAGGSVLVVTMTRAWWTVATGMIVAVPGLVVVAIVKQITHIHHLGYVMGGILLLGLAIVAVGVVQVTRATVRTIGYWVLKR